MYLFKGLNGRLCSQSPKFVHEKLVPNLLQLPAPEHVQLLGNAVEEQSPISSAAFHVPALRYKVTLRIG